MSYIFFFFFFFLNLHSLFQCFFTAYIADVVDDAHCKKYCLLFPVHVLATLKLKVKERKEGGNLFIEGGLEKTPQKTAACSQV